VVKKIRFLQEIFFIQIKKKYLKLLTIVNDKLNKKTYKRASRNNFFN